MMLIFEVLPKVSPAYGGGKRGAQPNPFHIINTISPPPHHYWAMAHIKDFTTNTHFSSVRKPDGLRKSNQFLLKDYLDSHKQILHSLSFINKQQIQLGLNNHNTLHMLKLFIMSQTYCPVRFTWKKMRPQWHYHPKWIKQSNCVKKSCSIPAGMSCSPSSQTLIPILRWTCPLPGNNTSSCHWIKSHIPITTQCYCSC